MRQAAVLLIVALVVLIFVALSLTGSLVVAQQVVAVSNAQGQVEVVRSPSLDYRPLGTTRWLRAGDFVRTGPDGRVNLNWADRTHISVEPGSTLMLKRCQLNKRTHTETSIFRLDVGSIWVRVLELLSQQSKLEIQTPTATAGVRGTRFMVAVDNGGETTIQVAEGSVAVQGAGQVTEVHAGQMTSITESALVTRDISPEVAEQIRQRLQ